MKTLLKGGQVVSGMGALAADVLIEGETILALGKDLETKGCQMVDCSGKLDRKSVV